MTMTAAAGEERGGHNTVSGGVSFAAATATATSSAADAEANAARNNNNNGEGKTIGDDAGGGMEAGVGEASDRGGGNSKKIPLSNSEDAWSCCGKTFASAGRGCEPVEPLATVSFVFGFFANNQTLLYYSLAIHSRIFVVLKDSITAGTKST